MSKTGNTLSILIFLLSLLLTQCDNSFNNANNPNKSSSTTIVSGGKTIITNNGNLDIIQDSFVFFMPDKKQGYFIYPQSDISLFKTHFLIRLAAYDIVQCGMIASTSGKKYMKIYAELTKEYKGDISGIADICSGENSTIYTSNGQSTSTFNTSSVKNFSKFKSPKFIFPYIPFFVSSTLNDIASPTNDPTEIYLRISFFDRLSKTTMTNCTTYTVDNVENTRCFGTPIIYPETDFYGKKYKALNLHSIRARIEYLSNMVEQ